VFKHILVPLDFTAKNASALRVVQGLAEHHQAQVTLLHVIETIEYVEDEEISTFYDALEKRAREKLANCGQPLKAAQLMVNETVVVGKTARDIIGYSIQNGVDLVVLSSHKISLDEAPQGWATLSYQISILSQCPVMLVK
jgi:nucleotide-binding universal stress UspA family protein